MAKTIRYESKNGYRGTLEGTELAVIDANSRLKFHTYASNCRTEKDLRQFVDEFPEFLELMKGVTDDGVQ